MTESTETKTNFAGTYFERGSVLRLSNLARILGWIILAIYVLTSLVSLTQFLSQFLSGLFYNKGMMFADVLNLFTPYLLQPLPGVFYFVGLQAVSQGLLIFLDVEDNTRRAARNRAFSK